MSLQHTLTLLVSVIVLKSVTSQTLNPKRFPPNFMIGTATASYQVEGAWNEDGKGENIWDRLSHSIDSPVDEHHTGDIACDSYHKYKEDIALIRDLGVTHYRFSISWSRILPSGFNNHINEAGMLYYKNLIKELKDNNIEPMVTMFHWDTPQPLQDIGGWTNELMIDRFVDYARILFEHLGPDVKYWGTFNEPKQTCQQGYGAGTMAPAILSHGIGEYLCAHNVLKAHARVWHMYQDEFRQEQQGLISITIDSMWMEPDSDSELDKAAAERKIQFNFGWYAHPIIHGDYPIQMKELIAERSAIQGFNQSRLPEFTQDEIEYMKGTVDYLGLNYYTSLLVTHLADIDKTEISWEADCETYAYQPDHWETAASQWLKVAPWGLRKLMNWIKANYGDIPQIVTENGYSDDGSSLEDDGRISYYQQHLSSVRDALDDGVNVFGYTAWSLLDNFEWMRGYTEKFGLYSVDFNDPQRTRTPKKSVAYFRHVAETKCIVDECESANEVDRVVDYVKNSLPF